MDCIFIELTKVCSQSQLNMCGSVSMPYDEFEYVENVITNFVILYWKITFI